MRRKRRSDQVAEAMAAVPRVDFLPEDVRECADADQALPIGFGQTSSQPHTVANMLRLLDPQPGHKVLDVGAGSGWTTALLGDLVGKTGRVIGVELVPELTKRAFHAVAGYEMPWAEVRQAQSGVLGAPADGPFDRILVSAAAERLPDQLVDQLGPEGIMVVPVGVEMLRITRNGDDVQVTQHGFYSFVPLL